MKAKKPTKEQEFQKWLTAFRAGLPCLNVFLALETDSDDRLRPLWKDADRRHQRYVRQQKRLKDAQEQNRREWEEFMKKKEGNDAQRG